MPSKTEIANLMLLWHRLSGVDLVASCRVFVHVADRASFTDGAAAARVPQSVASRRVAALESHLGRRLFDRTTRRTALTPFGADMVPSARRLVELADLFEYDAEQARMLPLTVAVPETCALRDLAALEAAARERGRALELVPAAPAGRVQRFASRQVRAAVVAVAADAALWTVPLGVAGRQLPSGRFRVESLRPSRSRPERRRLWLQPEDDVPHVRDTLQQAGRQSGLLTGQIVVAHALITAAAAALGDDLLVCSRPQALELELGWSKLHDPVTTRGYAVRAADQDDEALVATSLAAQVADCLGALR